MLERDAVLRLGYSSDLPPGGAATQERWTLSEGWRWQGEFLAMGRVPRTLRVPTDNLEVADAQARVLLEGKLAFF